ncbi:MAG: hypothetical protein R3178_06380, partial [Rhodothermales bacterium]|nr:hypothetical protein [Rhodothermales bacterium]
MMQVTTNRSSLTAATILIAVVSVTIGCESDHPYEGVMDDVSYAGQVKPENVKMRVNAKGRPVAVSEFRGRFVWADYAAPWCSPCTPQSRVIRRLQDRYVGNVVFLTVMTSETPGPEGRPDQSTARSWASRFRLDPELVVAADDLYGRIIPSHMLYSPEGHTLFTYTGSMSESQIIEVLTQRMSDWHE